MRYGTRTACGTRWTRQGHRPVCSVKIGYEWGYLYALINPFTGHLFVMYFARLDKECFSSFMQKFLEHLQEKQQGYQQELQPVLIIGDRATAHTSCQLPEMLHFQPLPTACPELNPAERFFQELRRRLSNQVFQTKQHVEDHLSKLLEEWAQSHEKLSKLTLFSFYKWYTKL